MLAGARRTKIAPSVQDEYVTVGVATADQLLAMPDDGFRYELVQGVLRRMAPAGFEHGAIGMRLVTRLGTHVEDADLGVVLGPDTGYRIGSDPDTVRAPDVSFVRRARVAEEGLPKGYWTGAPDLAVEVISPGDTYAEVETKVEEWLDAGCAAVVVLNPCSRSATLYRSRSEVVRLLQSDDLCGELMGKPFIGMCVADEYLHCYLPSTWLLADQAGRKTRADFRLPRLPDGRQLPRQEVPELVN